MQAVLDHIAEHRTRAMAMLDAAARSQVEQALAELILARRPAPKDGDDNAMQRIDVARLAGSHIALLRAWLKEGEGACPSSRVAAMFTDVKNR